MSKREQYRLEIFVQGIPCIASIQNYYCHPGMLNPWKAPSDLDYYGYTELEYDLLDRKGYPAPWLERKLENDEIREHVDEQIMTQIEELKEDEKQRKAEEKIEEREYLRYYD